jgi:hypothetical protein
MRQGQQVTAREMIAAVLATVDEERTSARKLTHRERLRVSEWTLAYWLARSGVIPQETIH